MYNVSAKTYQTLNNLGKYSEGPYNFLEYIIILLCWIVIDERSTFEKSYLELFLNKHINYFVSWYALKHVRMFVILFNDF